MFYREPKDFLDMRYCRFFSNWISSWDWFPSKHVAEVAFDPIVPIFVTQGAQGDDGIDGLNGEEVSHFSSGIIKSV